MQIFAAPPGMDWDPATVFEQQVGAMDRRENGHGGRTLPLPAFGSMQHDAAILGDGDHAQAVYMFNVPVNDAVTQTVVMSFTYHIENMSRSTISEILVYTERELDPATGG